MKFYDIFEKLAQNGMFLGSASEAQARNTRDSLNATARTPQMKASGSYYDVNAKQNSRTGDTSRSIQSTTPSNTTRDMLDANAKAYKHNMSKKAEYIFAKLSQSTMPDSTARKIDTFLGKNPAAPNFGKTSWPGSSQPTQPTKPAQSGGTNPNAVKVDKFLGKNPNAPNYGRDSWPAPGTK